MEINKYIDWSALWEHEVDLTINDFLNKEQKLILFNFRNDSDVMLNREECSIEINSLDNLQYNICFSDSGGQNESDNQGWSREYYITLDDGFILKDITYTQG